MLAAFYIRQAMLFQERFISDPIGPKAFPVIIGVLLAAASLVDRPAPDPEPAWPASARLLEIALAAAVMLAYAQFLPLVGFVISTAVAAAYLAWRFGAGPAPGCHWRERSRAVSTRCSTSILGLTLARGPLGF